MDALPAARRPSRAFVLRLLRALAALLAFTALTALGIYVWFHHRTPPAPTEEALFRGVRYVRTLRESPRPVVIHLITVELDAPGLSFFVTPGDPTSDLPLRARTTTEFLEEFHVQVAINGDFFEPWYSHNPLWFYPHAGDPVKVSGPAISGGVRYAIGASTMQTLRISRAQRPSFTLPLDEAVHAISGEHLVDLGASAIASFHDVNGRQPRTAVGLDREEKRLFLVVVDGRQPSYSEGVTLPELADLLITAGAFTAMNLDGGGSSAMVVERREGGARTLDSPIHTRVPHRERWVGNHLGIFAAIE